MKYRPGMATALSFSGGTGSTCLLAMVLDNKLQRPENFVVVNADPGMENSSTYALINSYEKECIAQSIPFLRVARNLYQELLDLKKGKATRFDTPPFWTRNRKTGKRGRLLQKCTGAYKIAPMDRAIRIWLDEELSISKKARNIGIGTLTKWIGFSDDEWHRIKETRQRYVQFAYPLIDRRMNKSAIAQYFIDAGRQIPPRSVCSACYANDVAFFKEMYLNRPNDWAKAVTVDEAIRDLSQIGINDECFVSSTLVPLRVMAAMNFDNLQDQELVACHSGHCFL